MTNEKSNSGMNAANLRLVESAIMLALATVLSLIKVYQMPLGGSVTLCSMLPVLLIGYKYGFKWGVLTGFTYGVIQLLLDVAAVMSWGLTPVAVAASFAFDYLLAFTCLGLAGIYGKSFPKFVAGMFTAVFLRFLSHVISGVTAYASWLPDEWHGHLWLYSIAYNGSYVLPDFAVCLVVGALLYKPLRRFL
ncbi:proton-coupled thiamine transporter YuaJ [Caproiciproducens sp. NJN-50]|uniref:energy-coupled thiamine transporter ThiT n=1 Tax=Acutalibacteraceae TaxID=3082771 RepID=UPI000FFDF8F5|nr:MULTISPECIES: energy-coupled thiamine transporter ThiT [Acutalibacteraceae]QAT48314.1 proton-coupled thiamine transporter YuaJ [Caproiciproducens sp. NJN-50]